MAEWALNVFNLPLAGHDGDHDTQISSLPPPPPGTPIAASWNLRCERARSWRRKAFRREGDPDYLRCQRHAGHLPDLEEYRARHQPAGARSGSTPS